LLLCLAIVEGKRVLFTEKTIAQNRSAFEPDVRCQSGWRFILPSERLVHSPSQGSHGRVVDWTFSAWWIAPKLGDRSSREFRTLQPGMDCPVIRGRAATGRT
jgi:hypothetical protein